MPSTPSLLSSPALRTYATQMNDMPLELSQSVSQVQRQSHAGCSPREPRQALHILPRHHTQYSARPA
eukprot:scaffold79832_cov67-Phaeocystis_antarctica.AAC.1